jgi:hypothetical protein
MLNFRLLNRLLCLLFGVLFFLPGVGFCRSFIEDFPVTEQTISWSGDELRKLGDSDQDFLKKAYLLVLGRNPKEEELEAQAERSFQDNEARAMFIQSLCCLSEFSETHLVKLQEDEQYSLLKAAFLQFLRREPTPMETHKCMWALRRGEFFLQEISEGQSREQTSEGLPANCLNGILQRLDEFVGLSDIELLKTLFNEKFGREPTLYEYAFHLGGMPYGLTSRSSLITTIRLLTTDNPQGTQKKLQKAFDQVQGWFQRYQNTDPGPEDCMTFVGAIYYGQLPPEEVEARIAGKSASMPESGPQNWKKDLFFGNQPSFRIEFDMEVEDLATGRPVDVEVFKLSGGASLLIKVVTGKEGLVYDINLQGKSVCYRPAAGSHRFRVEWAGTETGDGAYMGRLGVHFDGTEVVVNDIPQYPAVGFIGLEKTQEKDGKLVIVSWIPVSGL